MVIANFPPLHPALAKLSRNTYLKLHNANPTEYIDVFVGFFSLAQGTAHKQNLVQSTLF